MVLYNQIFLSKRISSYLQSMYLRGTLCTCNEDGVQSGVNISGGKKIYRNITFSKTSEPMVPRACCCNGKSGTG